MDLSGPEVLLSLALGIGLAAAVGLRVFVPLLVLGGAARMEMVTLGADFAWLASAAGLATLAVASLVEVTAYYFPAIDNLLDVIAGPVAVIAGVVTLAAVTTDLPSPLRWGIAILAGGGTAGLVQGLTTVTRLKSTGLTGGLANPILATGELVGSAFVAVLAIAAPLFALLFIVSVMLFVRRIARHRRTQSGLGV